MIEEPDTSSDASAEPDYDDRPTDQSVQPATDKPAPQKDKGKQVVVRYGRMMHLGMFRHNLKSPPVHGAKLVVRTNRGTELATVVTNIAAAQSDSSNAADLPWNIENESLRQYLDASGPEYPFSSGGKVLRRANPQDLNDQQHLDRSANEEGGFCREQINKLGLDMKIIAVEHLLGGERVVFYFTAEHRVDFRELVRLLAGQYHTRIEMFQVGARDEARLLADYERCGRQCCCREYLKILKPVSMRMAKTQKATLDPTKISGRCGRLMCCLRYEDATYEDLRKRLPMKNIWVRTSDGVVGKVLETQIITQLVRLMPADRSQVVVANEEIVERGLPAPPEQSETPSPQLESARQAKAAQPRTGAPSQPSRRESTRDKRAADSADGPPEASQPPQPSAEPENGEKTTPVEQPPAGREPPRGQSDRSSKRPKDGRKRRPQSRRRSQKKKGHPGALSAAPQISTHPAKPQQTQRDQKKRRRKRKK